ncbi:hypothetical protein B0H13DRAFT_1914040 [Mycena leptocephala]|nr:hypothetical protein B0H13DRAFT_1914040 [Mycena leptocephala]
MNETLRYFIFHVIICVLNVALVVLFVALCELLRIALVPLVPTTSGSSWATVAAAASGSEDAGVSNAAVVSSAVVFDVVTPIPALGARTRPEEQRIDSVYVPGNVNDGITPAAGAEVLCTGCLNRRVELLSQLSRVKHHMGWKSDELAPSNDEDPPSPDKLPHPTY